MTTLTYQSGLQTGGPSWVSHTHTGTDGKYAVVGAVSDEKWNSYTKLHWTHTQTPVKTGSQKGTYPLSSDAVPSASHGFTNNDELKLGSKLITAVKGHQFNMAVAVGEGSRTVKLVSSTASTLGWAFLDLKHGNFSSAARRLGVPAPFQRRSYRGGARGLQLKDVSARWLEMQYGWLPLLSDVHEAANAFHAIAKGPRRDRVRVARHITTQLDVSQSIINYSNSGPVRTKKVIIYEMVESLSAARQLGLLDPLSLTWELLPYSFVVDWFIPIGTYLENLNQIPKLRGRFLTTYVAKHNFSSVLKPGAVGAWGGATCRGSSIRINRQVSSSLSVQTPQFKSWPEAMSPKHIWNAIALLHQRFH